MHPVAVFKRVRNTQQKCCFYTSSFTKISFVMFCAKQKMVAKICYKINGLLSGFSENAYVMLFSHSMETNFSFL